MLVGRFLVVQDQRFRNGNRRIYTAIVFGLHLDWLIYLSGVGDLIWKDPCELIFAVVYKGWAHHRV